MYEAVHAAPDGESTVARFAATAADAGFDGVVVRSSQDARPEYDAGAIAERYGVDVVDGVEVDAEGPDEVTGHVGRFRPETTVLVVRGGSAALNRYAVHSPAVDVLAAPMAGEGDIDHALVKAAARNGVRLEVDLGPVLRGEGGPRVRAVQRLRKLRELVADVDAPYVVSARPRSHLQVRAPRELLAVGESVGFDRETIRAGLVEWSHLAARNRRRQSGEFIAPGVRHGRYEEEP
jgi:ribonuclease P/MRP protein subunit RPP1